MIPFGVLAGHEHQRHGDLHAARWASTARCLHSLDPLRDVLRCWETGAEDATLVDPLQGVEILPFELQRNRVSKRLGPDGDSPCGARCEPSSWERQNFRQIKAALNRKLESNSAYET